MNFIRRPWEILEDWRNRRRRRCVVYTEHPPMKIEGRSYEYENIMNNYFEPYTPSYYFAFFDIPYAQPPTGERRFQPPQPLKYTSSPRIVKVNWDQRPRSASQYIPLPNNDYGILGEEDCLYLNIYMLNKPKVNLQNSPLPVMVYIHGGGHPPYTGNILDISPVNIIKQNLIFVAVHYRLDILGFLNMDTENCRGNAGLKDQVFALRWVKNNIDKFGGDPNNVTLCGHSVGATYVNLHMISPLSRGLFHKAIVMAGGIYCPWGFRYDGKKRTRLLQKVLDRSDLKELVVECLKSTQPYKLLKVAACITMDQFNIDPRRFTAVFGPSIEKFPDGAFLSGDLEYMIRNARPVPVLAGIVQYEGYLRVQELSPLYPYKRTKKGFSELVTNDDEFRSFLMKLFSWGAISANARLDLLRTRYFRFGQIDIDLGLADLITDVWFHRFYDNFKIGLNQSPIYVYQFCYLSENDHRKSEDKAIRLVNIPLKGPMHGDDIMFLLYPERVQRHSFGPPSPATKSVIAAINALWGNFCKEGSFTTNLVYENIVWKPHTDEEPYYLRIDASSRGSIQGIPIAMNGRRWENMKALIKSELSLQNLELTHISLLEEYLPTSYFF